MTFGRNLDPLILRSSSCRFESFSTAFWNIHSIFQLLHEVNPLPLCSSQFPWSCWVSHLKHFLTSFFYHTNWFHSHRRLLNEVLTTCFCFLAFANVLIKAIQQPFLTHFVLCFLQKLIHSIPLEVQISFLQVDHSRIWSSSFMILKLDVKFFSDCIIPFVLSWNWYWFFSSFKVHEKTILKPSILFFRTENDLCLLSQTDFEANLTTDVEAASTLADVHRVKSINWDKLSAIANKYLPWSTYR